MISQSRHLQIMVAGQKLPPADFQPDVKNQEEGLILISCKPYHYLCTNFQKPEIHCGCGGASTGVCAVRYASVAECTLKQASAWDVEARPPFDWRQFLAAVGSSAPAGIAPLCPGTLQLMGSGGLKWPLRQKRGKRHRQRFRLIRQHRLLYINGNRQTRHCHETARAPPTVPALYYSQTSHVNFTFSLPNEFRPAAAPYNLSGRPPVAWIAGCWIKSSLRSRASPNAIPAGQSVFLVGMPIGYTAPFYLFGRPVMLNLLPLRLIIRRWQNVLGFTPREFSPIWRSKLIFIDATHILHGINPCGHNNVLITLDGVFQWSWDKQASAQCPTTFSSNLFSTRLP